MKSRPDPGPGRVRRFMRQTAAVGLALLGWCSFAGAAGEEFVQVEVIAFRHRGAEAAASTKVAEVPDFSTAFRLAPVAEGDAARAPTPPWQALGAHELKLAGANRALARSGAVDLLVHAGWRQPTAGGRAVYVGGSVALAESADVEAEKQAFEGAISLGRAGAQYRLGASFVARSAESEIVLREIRALKVDELHYLDHPRFGVLVEVTPWTDPAGASAPPPAETLSLPLEPRAPQRP